MLCIPMGITGHCLYEMERSGGLMKKSILCQRRNKKASSGR